MNFYIQIDERNAVMGYSSNKVNDTDILKTDEEVNNIFTKAPIFYLYDRAADTFSYSKELEDEFNKLKEQAGITKIHKDIAQLKSDVVELKDALEKLKKVGM